jgi:uncharacterized protein
MSALRWITFLLVIIGGLNWGLAVFNINLVTAIFGSWPTVVNVVYALVGLSALYELFIGWGKK